MKRLALLLCAGLLAGCTDDAKEVGDPTGKISAPPAAEDATPLLASVPETISPQWGAFFSEKGLGRATPMPAPDDLEGWNAVQAANNEAKEGAADEKAAAFGVTYEASEIAGIPVLEVTPSELASAEKIAVYTHGGAYVLNSAKAVIEAAMFFAAETGLRVIAVDYTLAPHFQVAGDNRRGHQCLQGAGRAGLHSRRHRPFWRLRRRWPRGGCHAQDAGPGHGDARGACAVVPLGGYLRNR